MPRGKAKNQTPKADAATEALIDPVKTEQREKRIERRGKPLLELVVEYRDPEHLTPYVNNAKEHPTEQIDNIAGSIAEFNFDQPIVVDEQGVIIKGHGRRAAAIRLGMKSVPVIVRSDLTEVQKKAARIADNKVAESSWSKETLSLELKSLTLDNFDMNLTGFNTEELKEYLTFQVEELPPADLTPPDGGEVPKVPVSAKGDIWILGKHRLMCGDSTSVDDLKALMQDEKANIICTDPPYGVNYKGGAKKRVPLENDHVGTNIYAEALPVLASFAVKNAPLYLWYADVVAAAAAAAAAGYSIKAQIVWSKNNAQFVTSAHYKGKHELCFYAVPEGQSAPWHGPNNEVTVWEVDRAHSNDFHPTQKPIELTERMLNNSSALSDILLDGFGGSGSSLIAAEKVGRHARVMELSPGYVDVIIKRWQEYTQQEAFLLSEDVSFAEMKERRNV